MSLKLLKELNFNSTYHFAETQVRDLWKISSLTLLSINDLDEHHNWYVMMSVEVSSPILPLNLRISEGILEGIFGHEGLWDIGSFIN
jgi:hypothetical protein